MALQSKAFVNTLLPIPNRGGKRANRRGKVMGIIPDDMIRMGMERILYATTTFLDSITVQYERARIESAMEDSLQRVKSHENALKDI